MVTKRARERLIKITHFKDLYDGDPLGKPKRRAASLAHTAEEFYGVCQMLKGLPIAIRPGPGVRVLLLHQTIELYVKAIAWAKVKGFNPLTYRHDILKIVDSHKSDVPVFAKLADSEATKILLEELRAGYLSVRYGEAHVAEDRETWKQFVATVEDLRAMIFPVGERGGAMIPRFR